MHLSVFGFIAEYDDFGSLVKQTVPTLFLLRVRHWGAGSPENTGIVSDKSTVGGEHRWVGCIDNIIRKNTKGGWLDRWMGG